MKILNLFAGLGGNSNYWSSEEHDITHVELEPEIAKVLQDRKPNETVIIGDAYQYLLNNYKNFDFIWASPPCQKHSKMNLATRHNMVRYVDGRLFEIIIFLKTYFKGKWVVENVVPYYEAPFSPKRMGRHLFWSNFQIEDVHVEQPKGFINLGTVEAKKKMMDWLGIHYEKNIYYGNNHCPVQILRNCVHPITGQFILNNAMGIYKPTLFSPS